MTGLAERHRRAFAGRQAEARGRAVTGLAERHRRAFAGRQAEARRRAMSGLAERHRRAFAGRQAEARRRAVTGLAERHRRAFAGRQADARWRAVTGLTERHRRAFAKRDGRLFRHKRSTGNLSSGRLHCSRGSGRSCGAVCGETYSRQDQDCYQKRGRVLHGNISLGPSSSTLDRSLTDGQVSRHPCTSSHMEVVTAKAQNLRL